MFPQSLTLIMDSQILQVILAIIYSPPNRHPDKGLA